MTLILSLIGAVIAMAHRRQSVVAEHDDPQVPRIDAYKRHRMWLLSELSRPDLKTFAVLAFNIAMVSMLVKDAKVLVSPVFFVPTLVFGALSCLSLIAALWSRTEKTKVKTVADLDAKVSVTEEQLQAQLLSLEKILRKKHAYFNWGLVGSAIMILTAFTGAIA